MQGVLWPYALWSYAACHGAPLHLAATSYSHSNKNTSQVLHARDAPDKGPRVFNIDHAPTAQREKKRRESRTGGMFPGLQ